MLFRRSLYQNKQKTPLPMGAADQEGNELDVLITKQRDKKAAIKYFKKLVKKQRQQQRQMRQFKSTAQAQRFLANHGVINNHFRQQRHLLWLSTNVKSGSACEQWTQVTCAQNLVMDT